MTGKKFKQMPMVLKVEKLYTFFKAKREKDYYFDGEMHDFWELVYVESGRIGVSEDDNVYGLEAGQIIFHRPMELHKLWAEETSELFIASFIASGDALEKLSRGVFSLDYESKAAYEAMLTKFSAVFGNLRRLVPRIKEDTDDIDMQIAANKMEAFLLSVIKSATISDTKKKSRTTMNYQLIIRVINEHIDEELSIEKIAGLCSMSVSNVKKVFRRYGGEGIMKYVTHLKLKKAIAMLEEGMTIAEVSERLSFSSQNYFSAVFKREMGFVPSKLKI